MKKILLVLFAMLFVACTPRYIEVPKEVIKEHTKIHVVRDTLRQQDSVIIREVVTQMQKGDTVYIYRDKTERVSGKVQGTSSRIDTVNMRDNTRISIPIPIKTKSIYSTFSVAVTTLLILLAIVLVIRYLIIKNFKRRR